MEMECVILLEIVFAVQIIILLEYVTLTVMLLLVLQATVEMLPAALLEFALATKITTDLPVQLYAIHNKLVEEMEYAVPLELANATLDLMEQLV